jgi:hypothetical protein
MARPHAGESVSQQLGATPETVVVELPVPQLEEERGGTTGPAGAPPAASPWSRRLVAPPLRPRLQRPVALLPRLPRPLPRPGVEPVVPLRLVVELSPRLVGWPRLEAPPAGPKPSAGWRPLLVGPRRLLRSGVEPGLRLLGPRRPRLRLRH